jgi:integrase
MPRKPTRKRKPAKPSKPHRDFPLFRHATGRWCKKVRGRLHYFGKVADDPDGQQALALWLEQRDDLLAGRTPRPNATGLRLAELCNGFLTNKRDLVEAGERSQRTWLDYKTVSQWLVTAFGRERLVTDLVADDFAHLRRQLAKRLGPVALGNAIQRVRTIFKWGFDSGLLDRPVRFGPDFTKPSRRVMRLARQAKGPRLFSREELRAILDAAGQPLRAMILLGLNCGFGNSDVAGLPIRALDLDAGWVAFPRPKTAVPRRCPLWPETIQALRQALELRPKPKDSDATGLVFVTKYGAPWHKQIADSPISKEFAKVLKRLGLQRPGHGFYTLRHVFRTVADEVMDRSAIDVIMGHEPEDVGGKYYLERVDDARLRRVTDHVHAWLFGSTER